jgi:flagellar biosynthesis protein FliP
MNAGPTPAQSLRDREMAFASASGVPSAHAGAKAGQGSRKKMFRPLWFVLILLLLGSMAASAQTNFATGFGPVQITLGANNGTQDVDTGIKVLFFITLLTLAPSILLLMTCFTRIVIVLSFVRTALQLQGTPANQIIIGLALFLTYFVMAPVWENINRDAVTPYQAQQISGAQALDRASVHVRAFMLRQTRPRMWKCSLRWAGCRPPRPKNCRCGWSFPHSSSANCARRFRWASSSSCRSS